LTIDLNSDLGESFGDWKMGDDAAMLDIVTSANIACGFHAGDPDVMLRTVRAARAKGVTIGAHPGFHDLQGFGRRRIEGLGREQIEALVGYQVGALQAVAALAGHRVTHVKPHGALSNMACEDEELAAALAEAIQRIDPALVFVVLPNTAMERAGAASGLALARELFADRAYDDRCLLLPRSQAGAVLTDPADIAARAVKMVKTGTVASITGRVIPVRADTLCIHGDSPDAVAIARAVRAALLAQGIEIGPFSGR
jgi:UPF0271 protein